MVVVQDPVAATGWRGELALAYRLEGGRTVARHAHQGPLRVLQPLHPEGPAICHHVLVHPPGGLVGGDELHVEVSVAEGAHALLTTPGATRFYRSEGATALQQVRLRLDDGARLEWLPLETIAHAGCRARNELTAELHGSAEALGWELLALGLPAARQPFDAGEFRQRIELPGRWLEQGGIAAGDATLLGPGPGWDGQNVLATLWFACGEALPAARREALLAAARGCIAAHALAPRAGVSAPQPGVLVLRALAAGVEPAMGLLQQVRAAWRREAWGLAAEPPRIWRS